MELANEILWYLHKQDNQTLYFCFWHDNIDFPNNNERNSVMYLQ